MRFGYKVLALVASVLSATPAAAADLGGGGYKDMVETAPQQGYSWAGFSAAFGLGGTFTDNQFSYEGTDLFSLGTSGFDIMGRAQYDWQFGHWTFGPYVDVNYAWSSNKLFDSTLGYGVGLELGYVDGSGKIYGKAGWERSHLKSASYDISGDRDALRVGGGIEFRLSRHFILFAEGDVDLFPDVKGYVDENRVSVNSTNLTALAGIRVPLN